MPRPTGMQKCLGGPSLKTPSSYVESAEPRRAYNVVDKLALQIADALRAYCREDSETTSEEVHWALYEARDRLGGCHDPDDPGWRSPYLPKGRA